MENQEQQTIQPQMPVQPAPETQNLASQGDALENQPKKSLPKLPLIITGIILLLAVLLSGTYILGKNQNLNPKPVSKTIQNPTATATPTPDPTANWETYTNSKVGVKFKYPAAWTAKSDPNWTLTVFLDDHPFEIDTQSEPPSTSITVAFNEQGDLGERTFREKTLAEGQQNIEKLFDQTTIKVKQLTIGGKNATQITGQGTGMLSGYLEYTLIQMDNKLLMVELKNQNFENIYQELLSTFKFTSPTTQTTQNLPAYLDASSATNNGITATIFPSHGKPGTIVTIKVSGLPKTTETPAVYLQDSSGGSPDTAMVIHPSEIVNNSFTSNYAIPSTLLTFSPGAQNLGPEGPTAKGLGKIVIIYTNSTGPSNSYVTVPFTVE
jgi:hypothetical protein